MFLILLGGSLTFGAALLATVVYTEGALLALRTAAQIIGWLFVIAALAGVMGLRRASLGPICAASITVCSGLAVLYMSYFFEWHESPRAAIRQAAVETFSPVETFSLHPVTYTYKTIEPVMRPAEVQAAPRRKVIASAQPVSLAVDACSALSGVESLQCTRCDGQLGFAWVMCQERVRLEYCESGAGDERTCPSPIPHSHPG